jgi:hypothetical protein
MSLVRACLSLRAAPSVFDGAGAELFGCEDSWACAICTPNIKKHATTDAFMFLITIPWQLDRLYAHGSGEAKEQFPNVSLTDYATHSDFFF